MEFRSETGAIGSSMKMSFHPYIERPKRTPYTAWASILVRAVSGLRGELELELFWASTLVTRIGLALDLLHDLDNLVGLLLH